MCWWCFNHKSVGGLHNWLKKLEVIMEDRYNYRFTIIITILLEGFFQLFDGLYGFCSAGKKGDKAEESADT